MALTRILQTPRQLLRRLAPRRANVKSVFCEIHRRNAWLGSESVSGPGSSLEQTRVVRQELPDLLRQIGAKTLLNAPCGDFYWMSAVRLDLDRYVGVDVVPSLIARNRQTYGDAKREFLTADIIVDTLPRADIILCRDCLVHLSYDHIARALRNFQESGASYLLTTTFTDAQRSNEEIVTGAWRPVNLERPPFCFPKPLRLINEACTEDGGRYADKSLGLWKLDELPG